MKTVTLGKSDLQVTSFCLGTMTFGEQVDEATAHAILDRALERSVNFIDTAEMYSVPTRAETYGATETIIGNWFARRPGARQKLVLATKVAGPARGMNWIRNGSAELTPQDIVAACEASLKRLQTDVIDLYQIHWPVRHVPSFGALYFDPSKDQEEGTSLQAQLEALATLIQAGKVRAIGLSNETPFGVHEFVRLAEQYGLPRIATVQNCYNLSNRGVENGLDETLYRLDVSLLAYSPLAFGLLTGKYDATGFNDPAAPVGRMTLFENMKKQRFGRPASQAAAKRYNALAREHGLTPTQMALTFCQSKWQVASTILGVTTVAQLDEDLECVGMTLSKEVLTAIDAIRWEIRDPAV